MLAPDLLAQSDPEVWDAIRQENQRQEDHVELIASENYVSRAVLMAQGSQLTNKYAEGYPGKRYYGGCEFVDIAETIAIERAKKLFGAPWANVQPHSGSQANQAVYTAALKPGDTILGMSLAMGGHLTHGSPVNLSGKLYRVVSYGLTAKEEIDYDQAEKIALAEKPKLIVTGASAYALAIDWKRFRAIADKCGALLMADIAHYAGLIAAGLYPSPFGIAHFVTTTNHKTLRGPRGGMVFGSPVNLSGKLYRVVSYGLTAKEEIDYDQAEKIALAEKPKLIVTGASAYALAIDWKRFRAIADKCGALLMADIAHYAGLIAAGLYPSPFGVAHFVTTTNHKTLRGPRGGMVFGLEEFEKPINSAIFPGLQGGPLMHVIAAKAVALGEALKPEFKVYQKQVMENAKTMAAVLQKRGLRIVSGRTESHMFLVDLTPKNLTGKDAEAALGRAHITVNKNAIPNDPQKPMVTSGVRIGSPAMTTRGFKKNEAEALANLIADVLDKPTDEAHLARVASRVKALCSSFPVYR